MKKLILFLLCCMLLGSFNSNGQLGPELASTTYIFTASDSLMHFLPNPYFGGFDTIVLDTTTSHLWQIGNTHKLFFENDTIASRGIMTDTLNAYPANVNEWFTIKMFNVTPNPTIDVWHEYQTDSAHAGGVIEFSTDSGATWLNIADCGNFVSQYYFADTLLSGQPAFTGTSNGQQHLQFLFFDCIGVKTTQPTSCSYSVDELNSLFIRFRFISDSTIDTLSGWKIDSIRIGTPGCPGAVPTVSKNKQLTIYPNPAYDGVFHFPDLDNEGHCTIDVFNELGDKIITMPYGQNVNVSNYSKGLYFYKVTGDNEYYSGKLLYD